MHDTLASLVVKRMFKVSNKNKENVLNLFKVKNKSTRQR